MRADRVDDEVILACAKRLMDAGTYPTARAVARALDWRWVESTVSLGLARLGQAGRLVVEMPKPVQAGARESEPKYDPERVAELARQVRYERLRQPEREEEHPAAEWDLYARCMRAIFGRDWRRLYRRGSPCH
jgi:hypothetical protein